MGLEVALTTYRRHVVPGNETDLFVNKVRYE